MFFSSLLHIFQNEHYDRKRFLKFVYSHFDWWNFSVRGKTTWTLRARLIALLSIFFMGSIGGGVLFISPSIFVSVGVLLCLVASTPLFIILADFFILPIVDFQKRKIFAKAKHLVSLSGVQTVAVTGSFGKTTMKTIIDSVLSQKFAVFTVTGNINTGLGVANFLLNHAEKLKNSEILLLEMGAYKMGEIASICSIVQPDYSFVTAIAPVHLERFGSIENIVKAKMELPDNTKKRAYFLSPSFLHIPKPKEGIQISAKEAEDSIEFLPNFSGLSFVWENTKFSSKLIASHTVEQMVGALTLAKELGLSTQQMQQGIKNIPFPKHRLEVSKNPNTGVTVIDDSYNGNMAGFIAGIQTLQRAMGRKIVLTPGIVELGEMQEKVHTELAKLYSQTVDVLLLIENSNTKIIRNYLLNNAHNIEIKTYKTAMQAHQELGKILKKDDTILFQNDLPDNYR